jgi:hypothetical protein
MDKQESKSEVARLLRQIELEYEAASRGLSGFAQGTSQHAFITKKMENMSLMRDELASHVGEMDATRLMYERCVRLDANNAPVKVSNEGTGGKTTP